MTVSPVTAGKAHRPAACRDPDCPRPLCTSYRDGYEDGFGDGWAAGYQAGSAAAKGN